MLRSEILVTLLIFVALLSTTLVLSEEGDDKGVEEGSDPPYYVKIDVANFESYGDPHHGSFILKVIPEWAPLSAKRFKKLVLSKFYDNTRFFSVLPENESGTSGGTVQFGVKKGKAQKKWDRRPLKDEPLGVMSNLPGTVAFWADPKEHTRGRRCTSVVVNRADNADKLDHKHAPFGYIALGFEEVRIMPELPEHKSPRLHTIRLQGNEYLDRNFTKLTRLVSATLMEEEDVLGMLREGEELAPIPVFNKFGNNEL
mmetsp:Transcript_4841/g.10108  ORF Transcript_4841/g.10108 Transcript_4841/m.10108 type:complete len:256 (+) Transcript_4841:141-908(+)